MQSHYPAVKNYSKKQIVIDRENFNPAVVYPLAKKIFGKNFSRNPLAQSLYDDMIQEAVTRLFELSGKVKERANGKYSENYANFWVAHTAMLAFLKTWKRQNKWCMSFEDEADPILRDRKKVWSPELGGCIVEMGREKRRGPLFEISSCRFVLKISA